MNERLKQFLTMEGLSPARFADIMEIQRSGISHLLSGRNKPSFEFIQKMLTAYPALNPEWLILGKGKPYKDNVSTSTPTPAPQPSLPSHPVDLFTAGIEPEENTSVEEMPEEPELSDENEEIDDMPIFDPEISHDVFMTEQPDPNPITPSKTISQPSENPILSKPSIVSKELSPKKISRITVFYTDGTFEER